MKSSKEATRIVKELNQEMKSNNLPLKEKTRKIGNAVLNIMLILLTYENMEDLKPRNLIKHPMHMLLNSGEQLILLI